MYYNTAKRKPIYDQIYKTMNAAVGELAKGPAHADGLAFMGWYDSDGKRWDAETEIKEDVTLTARYGYKVTFKPEDADDIVRYVDEALGTLPTAPYREGYSFTGWYFSDTDGNADLNNPANANSVVAANCDIIGVYAPITVYTITVGDLTVSGRELYIRARNTGRAYDGNYTAVSTDYLYVYSKDTDGTEHEIDCQLTDWGPVSNDNPLTHSYTLRLLGTGDTAAYNGIVALRITLSGDIAPGVYDITPGEDPSAPRPNYEVTYDAPGTLTIGVARVSNDNAATWTYCPYLAENVGELLGAFEYADSLRGSSDVIVETLCDEATISGLKTTYAWHPGCTSPAISVWAILTTGSGSGQRKLRTTRLASSLPRLAKMRMSHPTVWSASAMRRTTRSRIATAPSYTASNAAETTPTFTGT